MLPFYFQAPSPRARRWAASMLSTFGLGALILGCSQPTATERLTNVRLSVASDTLLVKDSARLVATATDASGHVIAGAHLSWATSDPAIVTVTPSTSDTTALIVARAAGVATIVVSSGAVRQSATIVVNAVVDLSGVWDFNDHVGACADTGSFSFTQDGASLQGSWQLEGACGAGRAPYIKGPSQLDGNETADSVTVHGPLSDSSCVYVFARGSATGDSLSGAVVCSGSPAGTFVMVHGRAVAAIGLPDTLETLVTGDTVLIAARLTDAQANPLFLRPVQWSSSAPNVATVTPADGQIAAVSVGSATITASSGTASAHLRAVVSPFSIGKALGDLHNAQATAINRFGVVVGSGEFHLGRQHAFRWTADSGFTDLGTLGGEMSQASAINDAGTIVGNSLLADGIPAGFEWMPGSGIVQLTGMPEASAINNKGDVVGHGVLRDAMGNETALTPLTSRNTVSSFVGGTTGINDAETVVGVDIEGILACIGGPCRIFRTQVAAGWSAAGVATRLWLPGAATAINAGGTTAGAIRTVQPPFESAVLALPSGAQRLLPHAPHTAGDDSAYALNTAGDAVGMAGDTSGHRPVLWPAAGGVVVLSDTTGAALGINDARQIVGYVTVSGVRRAMLWTVTPAGVASLARRAGAAVTRARTIAQRGPVVRQVVLRPPSTSRQP